MNTGTCVWGLTENNKTRFSLGLKPGKRAFFVGQYCQIYNPDTGTMSNHFSYIPARYAMQPSARWLYEHTPQVRD